MIDIIGTLRQIFRRVNQIFDLVNAIFTLTETGGTLITAVAPGADIERDIYINDAPMGVYEPVAVKIDLSNLIAAEIVVIRTYYRYNIGGGFILEDINTYTGVQVVPSKSINLVPNRFGIQVTLERTAGAQRNHDWYVVIRV